MLPFPAVQEKEQKKRRTIFEKGKEEEKEKDAAILEKACLEYHSDF